MVTGLFQHLWEGRIFPPVTLHQRGDGVMNASALVDAQTEVLLKEAIRTIPDFPVPGIGFKDITPLLARSETFALAIDAMCRALDSPDLEAIVAIESRGFVVGAPLANRLGTGLILVRKPGKLPGEKDSFSYQCEYCSGTLEVHRDAIQPGSNYLIVDDLLATGGTARATADYVTRAGGRVFGFSFLVELTALKGRALLREGPVFSVLKF